MGHSTAASIPSRRSTVSSRGCEAERASLWAAPSAVSRAADAVPSVRPLLPAPASAVRSARSACADRARRRDTAVRPSEGRAVQTRQRSVSRVSPGARTSLPRLASASRSPGLRLVVDGLRPGLAHDRVCRNQCHSACLLQTLRLNENECCDAIGLPKDLRTGQTAARRNVDTAVTSLWDCCCRLSAAAALSSTSAAFC